MPAASIALDSAFQAHERLLWNICYRLTGVPADADDLVQETFLRAMERPPARTDDDLRPWLVRVAVNLGRDLLRRRRRRGWKGPWLPGPVETADDDASLPAYEPDATAGRYDLVESVTLAFLTALEALTPTQRAVLLLRDVFDHSVDETAAALGLSVPNVKTTHHRARRAMAAYDRTRQPPTRSLQERTRAALERFMLAIATDDGAAIAGLLAPDVRAVSDGGGEFHAARVPVVGAAKVAKFFRRLNARRVPGERSAVRMLNGLPAIVFEFATGRPGDPPRGTFHVDLDADGRIRAIHSVLVTRKLGAVRF
jgi:RNA polymerase sigma-70 factor (ECF subfamily)